MNLLLRPDGVRRGPRCEALVAPWVLVLDGTVVHCDLRPPDGLPEGVETVRGGWLLEPLADAHVHLFLAGSADADEQKAARQLPEDEALERVLGLLEAYRRAGVAAVRDGGDPRGLALRAARVANRNRARYAAVLPAGEPIFRRGRYGAFLGGGVDTPEEAVALMERNHREGASHVKILATGLNSLEEAGRVGPPQFKPAELSELFVAAESLGAPVMVHANGPLAAAGCLPRRGGSLEHGFWLEEGDLDRLAGSPTPWVPTLGAWEELSVRLGSDACTSKVLAATAARHRAEVAEGRRRGVPVLSGSDAGSPGVPHVRGLVGEVMRLSEVLGSGDGLASSTWRARELCESELGESLGGLTVGGSAGFVRLARDPLADREALSAPLGVFLGGDWSPADLQESSQLLSCNQLQ